MPYTESVAGFKIATKSLVGQIGRTIRGCAYVGFVARYMRYLQFCFFAVHFLSNMRGHKVCAQVNTK